MQNILKSILAMGALVAVHATPITFTDIVAPHNDVKLNQGNGNDTYTFTHSILDNGFNSATDAITGADIYINLADDGDTDFQLFNLEFNTEYVKISLDNLTAASSLEVDDGTYHFSVNTSSLQSDGTLTVKLEALSGDFYFHDSRLDVSANRTISAPVSTQAVPEPTSMAMMLAGLVGMAFVVRRKGGK